MFDYGIGVRYTPLVNPVNSTLQQEPRTLYSRTLANACDLFTKRHYYPGERNPICPNPPIRRRIDYHFPARASPVNTFELYLIDNYYASPLTVVDGKIIAVAEDYLSISPMMERPTVNFRMDIGEDSQFGMIEWIAASRLAMGIIGPEGFNYLIFCDMEKNQYVRQPIELPYPNPLPIARKNPNEMISGRFEVFSVDLRKRMPNKLVDGVEVISIRVHPDGHRIVLGDNNNIVEVRDLRNFAQPLQRYGHQAGVRALAINPADSSQLATGAGTHDRQVRLFDLNSDSKEPVSQVNTNAQVCNLLWSSNGRQLFGSLGFDLYELIAIERQDDSLVIADRITQAHAQRVLFMSAEENPSPENPHIVTASPDGYVKVWELYEHKRKRSALDSAEIR